MIPTIFLLEGKVMTNVAIRHKSNNIIFQIDDIYLRSLTNEVSIEEFYDEAWRNAVDDGLVDKSDRSDYFFEIIK
jgi:hypothetical protein